MNCLQQVRNEVKDIRQGPLMHLILNEIYRLLYLFSKMNIQYGPIYFGIPKWNTIFQYRRRGKPMDENMT